VRRRRNKPQALILGTGLLAAIALAPLLVGCGIDDSPIHYVIGAMGPDSAPLSKEAAQQLARFRKVYDKYAVDDGTGQFQLFSDAFKRVRTSYVREVKDSRLIDAAIAGVREAATDPDSEVGPRVVEEALDSMMGALDPHSSYLNPDELRETQVATRGEFGGLGIQVTMADGVVKVVSPIDDTPAYRAGLKAGDLITHMDGIPIEGKSLMEAVRHMRGKPGTVIRVTVVRKGLKPFEVAITRAVIKVQAVRWHTEGDVGYIRIVSFSEKAGDGLEKAMSAIRKKLGPRIKGIVLDLRNNPGGLLTQSLVVADDFLDKGLIVSVRGRPSTNPRVFEATNGDIAEGLPVVVLINAGSASASEIVASALQDNGRATIMGQRSFGKGSVQTITPLPVEGALRLTTALYYAPSGRTIQGHGVDPDIMLKGDAPVTRQREADLRGAIQAVSASDGRPRAVLEEDDCPVAGDKDKPDRQLGCALALLHASSTASFLASLGLSQPM